MGMTDKQFKALRRRDKAMAEQALNAETEEKRKKLLEEMVTMFQQDIEGE